MKKSAKRCCDNSAICDKFLTSTASKCDAKAKHKKAVENRAPASVQRVVLTVKERQCASDKYEACARYEPFN